MLGRIAQVAQAGLQRADDAATEVVGARPPRIAWTSLLPHLILMVGGVLLLTVVSLVKNRLPRGWTAAYTVAVAAGAFIADVALWGRVHHLGDLAGGREGPLATIAGAVISDGFTVFVVGLLCICVAGAALLADGYLRREGLDGPEPYVLLMLSAAGGAVMASAGDLIVLFLGLEILSIAVYVLAAMHARRVSSQEAGLKYFVLGAFASAFLLYGIALTYGATGSTNLARIQSFLSETVVTKNGMLVGGMAMMLAGFAFKIAAVPFHAWTPDVYQGAPTPVTAFMASAVKVGAFAGLIRVFVVALSSQQDIWKPIITVLAVLSLLVGSVMAVVQTNVKRMLAYSSINHAGFILLGVESATARGTAAALFYLLAYSFLVIGSFAVVTLVGRSGDSRHSLDDYRGLARARPVLAIAFAVLLLAQAGTPFTGGFSAKLAVISSAVDTRNYGLAIIAMVSAVVSAFLYLRIVVSMYFAGGGDHGDEPVELAGPSVGVPSGAGVVLAVAVLVTLILGVVPGPFADLARHATATLVAVGS